MQIADLSSKMVTESGWPISSSTHVFKLVAGADILHLDVPVPLAHLEAISIVINNTPLSSKEKGIPLVLRVIKRSYVCMLSLGCVYANNYITGCLLQVFIGIF